MTREELEKDMGRYAIIDGKIAPNPDIDKELARLARIDPREVYANPDMFCDSEEWLAERASRWLQQIEATENQTPNRRKEK